jgi:signal transduction histidine kinase
MEQAFSPHLSPAALMNRGWRPAAAPSSARPLPDAAKFLLNASFGVFQPGSSERAMPSPPQALRRPGENSRVMQALERLGPRRQPILIAASAAILFINVAILAWTSQQSQSQSRWARHSLEVEKTLGELLLAVRQAESEQRAYILAGAEAPYQASYLAAAHEIPGKLGEVRSMIADNPAQQAKLATLEPIINEKIEDLARKVRLLEAGDAKAAIELFHRNDKGRALMTDIDERIANMQAEEGRLLAVRSANFERSNRQLLSVALVDSFFLLVFGWLALSSLLSSKRVLESAKAALEAKVEERVAELREANNEMQSFAYIVGHDLRAPLVNIMGFTSELQSLGKTLFNHLGQEGEASISSEFDRKAARAEFDEALGFIKAATVKMERLISAILAISRAGKRELNRENIDVSALVNGVVETLAHEAQAVGAEIEVGTLPAIECDRLALEQVFTNLLDNAIKYLRPGVPGRIRIGGYATSKGVVYEVRDNGRGIAEADQRRVFELFRRAGAQDQRGEGMGLAYVRTMVRRLGGTIKLTSSLEGGSTFRVALPLSCSVR